MVSLQAQFAKGRKLLEENSSILTTNSIIPAKPIVSFNNMLTESAMLSAGLSYIKFDGCKYLYTQIDEATNLNEDYANKLDDIDTQIYGFCCANFEWDTIKAEFQKKGIDTSGSDKSVIMKRAIDKFRNTSVSSS